VSEVGVGVLATSLQKENNNVGEYKGKKSPQHSQKKEDNLEEKKGDTKTSISFISAR